MIFGEWAMALQLGLIYGLATVAIFFTFRLLNFADMTCDGSFMVGGCVASILVRNGCGTALALAAALSAGLVTGCATALLHIRFRVADILAGILVTSMAYSINLRILGGMPNLLLPSGSSCSVLLLIFCLIIVLKLGYFLNTDMGLAFRCVGQNRELARSQNISTAAMLTVGLAAANGCAGTAGAFFCLTQGFCDVGSGAGTLIGGLASLVIGEAIFPFRSNVGKVLACFLGSIAYRFAIALALRSEVSFLRASDFNLITGLLILFFFALNRRKMPCCA
jgi:putative ABC transport system permease protein